MDTVEVDSDEYVRGRPHPALSPYVRRYQGYREHSDVPLRRRQAPGATCTLILSLGPRIRLYGPAGPVAPASFLAGMHDTAVITEFTGPQHGVQVDLTPLGTYRLLGQPMSDLTNLTAPLDTLDVRELAVLPARLADADGWAAVFARIDAALLARLDVAPEPAPEVVHAWGRLERTGGTVTVGELATETGWSRRHLLNRFRTQVGLGPKTAARVLRFRRAADLLLAGASGTIADVAARCGYADHAHLVREFHALAGCSPTAYRSHSFKPGHPVPA